MQYETWKMHKLTLISNIWSMVIAVDGDDHIFHFSGDLLRKGIAKFANLRAPLHDSLHLDDLQDMAVLLDHAKDSGMVSIDDAVTNSGEVTRRDMQNKEIGRN
jgi:hypothetical protein